MIDLGNLLCPLCSSDFLEEGNMKESGLELISRPQEHSQSADSDENPEAFEAMNPILGSEPLRRPEYMMATLFRLLRGQHIRPPRTNEANLEEAEENDEPDFFNHEMTLQGYMELMRLHGMQGSPQEKNIEEIETIIIPMEMQDTECKICEENFKVDEEAKKLECEHCFHAQCLIPWLKIKSSCPTCRQSID